VYEAGTNWIDATELNTRLFRVEAIRAIVDTQTETLRRALKRMPAPEPQPGFVDRALANAAREPATRSRPRAGLAHLAGRWETWIGAALGGAVATVLMLILLRPLDGVDQPVPAPMGISMALNETRAIDVLIDSERTLEDATIRIVATGSVVLDGFENEREIGWRTHLDRGSNVLSLPVVARSTGQGQLVAVIEHEGRTRRMIINLTVRDT